MSESMEFTPESVADVERRIGRRLTKAERSLKDRLDTVCACGHSGHAHTAALLGGPDDHPCWAMGCPCYSFPLGLTRADTEAMTRV